jgi:hypothetical protein
VRVGRAVKRHVVGSGRGGWIARATEGGEEALNLLRGGEDCAHGEPSAAPGTGAKVDVEGPP